MSTCGSAGPTGNDEAIRQRTASIRHMILVLSGKGGVGKSTVSVGLAAGLHAAGNRVGILDVDVHGPSIPRLMGLEGERAEAGDEQTILPVQAGGIAVMSVGFLVRSSEDAVIWRGPMKHTVITQLIGQVAWGELDYLIIDAPPGTGDEPLSVCQLIPWADGAVIVTTPQGIAIADVRRSVSFCRDLQIPVLGIVENMSGFVCPECGTKHNLFGSGGGQRLASDTDSPFLGAVPIDPRIFEPQSRPDSPEEPAPVALADVFAGITDKIIARVGTSSDDSGSAAEPRKEKTMRIAIPMAEGKLALHFGHCQSFALVDVEDGVVSSQESVDAPPHEPGLLPRWLGEKGATVIIAGGMGSRARDLFNGQNIEVVTGAPRLTPSEIVDAYLRGTLATGPNACDH